MLMTPAHQLEVPAASSCIYQCKRPGTVPIMQILHCCKLAAVRRAVDCRLCVIHAQPMRCCKGRDISVHASGTIVYFRLAVQSGLLNKSNP
jgi:hypothetical protein